MNVQDSSMNTFSAKSPWLLGGKSGIGRATAIAFAKEGPKSPSRDGASVWVKVKGSPIRARVNRK